MIASERARDRTGVYLTGASIWSGARLPGLLFAVNGKPVVAEVDMHALSLMAVLVELIAQHGHRNRKRADDEIKDVGASHSKPSFSGIKNSKADET